MIKRLPNPFNISPLCAALFLESFNQPSTSLPLIRPSARADSFLVSSLILWLRLSLLPTPRSVKRLRRASSENPPSDHSSALCSFSTYSNACAQPLTLSSSATSSLDSNDSRRISKSGNNPSSTRPTCPTHPTGPVRFSIQPPHPTPFDLIIHPILRILLYIPRLITCLAASTALCRHKSPVISARLDSLRHWVDHSRPGLRSSNLVKTSWYLLWGNQDKAQKVRRTDSHYYTQKNGKTS